MTASSSTTRPATGLHHHAEHNSRHSGVTIDEIAQLVGHAGTSVTETVYRHQIRPVIQSGAERLDSLFDDL